MTTTEDTSEPVKVLDRLLSDFLPGVKRYADGERHGVFLAPKAPKISNLIRVPSWSWDKPGYEGTLNDPANPTVTMDVNGAYLAPLSGIHLAHGALEEDRDHRDGKAPGYYLIDAHKWSDPRIMSPLGKAALPASPRLGVPGQIWVTQPTLTYLQELTEAGYWPGTDIHASWTSEHQWRPTKWANWIKSCREDCIAAREEYPQDYQNLKRGYSQAISTIQKADTDTKRKSKVAHQDWALSIKAAHQANTHRKAWAMIRLGAPLLKFTKTDEITLAVEDYAYLTALDPTDPRVPFRFDNSGITLGAFKAKSWSRLDAPADTE